MNDVTCVSKRDKGMCSSGIAWVRAGSGLFGRDIECVWERGVRVRERASDGEREEERGGVSVQKWRIDREKMLICSKVAYVRRCKGSESSCV